MITIRLGTYALLAAAVGALNVALASGRETVVERYPSGAVMRVAEYRGNVLDGVVRGWYENGAIEYSRSYRHGAESGDHFGWYENGARKFSYHYASGVTEGVQRQWFPNGHLLTEFHHRAGHEAGQQRMWNADGSIRSNYVIADGRRYGLLGATGCTGRGMAIEGAVQ
ncbi:MAG TPA: hypothetical protein VE967_04690 [Gemmatimonadaceae bacterium]|nr:hypothetical protein [Gemmatimonadaceae bacterium]